jgi:hypothetical protein
MLLAAAREPRFDKGVIVVARDDHQLPTRERAPEVLEERPRGGQRFALRAVAQLEHIAEQHHALDVGDRLQQRRAQLGAAQQIGSGDAAEVQIGDD